MELRRQTHTLSSGTLPLKRATTRENYFDDMSLLCPVILDKDGHCFTEASGQDLCLK